MRLRDVVMDALILLVCTVVVTPLWFYDGLRDRLRGRKVGRPENRDRS